MPVTPAPPRAHAPAAVPKSPPPGINVHSKDVETAIAHLPEDKQAHARELLGFKKGESKNVQATPDRLQSFLAKLDPGEKQQFLKTAMNSRVSESRPERFSSEGQPPAQSGKPTIPKTAAPGADSPISLAMVPFQPGGNTHAPKPMPTLEPKPKPDARHNRSTRPSLQADQDHVQEEHAPPSGEGDGKKAGMGTGKKILIGLAALVGLDFLVQTESR